MMNVSVIMPTYNKASYLDLTLAGFSMQEYKDFEIIIIDDGGNDQTSEVVSKYMPLLNIKYKHQCNGGRASARNKALDMSEGRYAVFNDDDRIPCPGFLTSHLEALKSHEKTVSIGAKHVVLSRYHDEVWGCYFVEVSQLFRKNFRLLDHSKLMNGAGLFSAEDMIADFDGVIDRWFIVNPEDNYNDIISKYSAELKGFNLGWAIATTGNMAVDLKHAPDIRFDENFQGWGIEDNEYAYQLFKQGYTFRFSNNSINFHQQHPTEKNLFEQLINNIGYFVRKYENIEAYLLAMAFQEGKYKFSLDDANEVLNHLTQYPDNPLAKSYIRFCSTCARTSLINSYRNSF